MPLWYCPLMQLYFRQPCYTGHALLFRSHDDVDVSDMFSAADLDDRDLGYDLAWERWQLLNGAR